MVEASSVRKKEELDRKANAKLINKEVKKWQDIIKKNREANHLNFVEKNELAEFRMYHIYMYLQYSFIISFRNANLPESKIKTLLEVKVESKLKELNMFDEEDATKQDSQLLKTLPTKEAKLKLKQLANNRNLMFYQELKQKRISKIKSKLYHKIKKKVVLDYQLSLTYKLERKTFTGKNG